MLGCDAEEFVYVGTNRNMQTIVVKKRKKFVPCKSTKPLHSPNEGNDTRTCEQTHSIVSNLSKDPPIPTNSGMQWSYKTVRTNVVLWMNQCVSPLTKRLSSSDLKKMEINRKFQKSR